MSQDRSEGLTSGLLIIVFIFQIFAFGLWAGGPRTDLNRDCVFNVSLTKTIGHSVNCDSSEFVYAAAEPANVLDKESKRQSRPGTVLLVSALIQPPLFLLNTFAPDGDHELTFYDKDKNNEVAFTVSFYKFLLSYIGYIFLNIAILITAFKLYTRLSGLPIDKDNDTHLKTAAALCGVMVLVNNVTKQFFWSPHTQFFNLLAPLLALYLFKTMLETDRPTRLFIMAAIGSGIAMLFYGIFVLPITAAGLAFLWRKHESIKDVKEAAKTIGTGVLAIAIFFVPYMIWYGYIVARNGEFYNYDVVYYGGFVWMLNVARWGGWDTAILYWIGNFGEMFAGAIVQGLGYLGLLGALVLAAKKKYGLPVITEQSKILWIGAGVYALLAAVFFAFYGLTVYRLSFTITALVFPLIGHYLYQIEQKAEKPGRLRCAAAIAMCVYVVFMLVKYGPYS